MNANERKSMPLFLPDTANADGHSSPSTYAQQATHENIRVHWRSLAEKIHPIFLYASVPLW